MSRLILTAHMVFEYKGKQYEADDIWNHEWINEEYIEVMEFFWTEGGGDCDCNRSLSIKKNYPEFLELDCGDEINLVSIDIKSKPWGGKNV